jgi:hypothetical protein
VRGVRDEGEREHEQDVPEPPRELPRAADRGGGGSLREERPRGEHADEHDRRPATVEEPVAHGGDREQHHGDARDDRQRAARLVLQDRAVERRDLRDREQQPHAERGREQREDQDGVPQRPRRRRAREVERGEQREHRRDEEADGGRRGPPEVRDVEQDHRRRERVHREEARAGEERARDEEDARVVVAVRGTRDEEADQRGDHRGGEHQTEVRLVLLPAQVGAGLLDQQPEPERGQREVEHPHRGPELGRAAHHRDLRYGRVLFGSRVGAFGREGHALTTVPGTSRPGR